MAFLKSEIQQIATRLVFVGAPGSGKRTNLQRLQSALAAESCSEIVMAPAAGGLVVQFDVALTERPKVGDNSLQVSVVTLSGLHTVDALATVAREADALVLCFDSSPAGQAGNQEFLDNLNSLGKQGIVDLATVPMVVQFNKRDAQGAVDLRQLDARYNLMGVPSLPASATQGQGVVETFHRVCDELALYLRGEMNLGPKRPPRASSMVPQGVPSDRAPAPVLPPPRGVPPPPASVAPAVGSSDALPTAPYSAVDVPAAPMATASSDDHTTVSAYVDAPVAPAAALPDPLGPELAAFGAPGAGAFDGEDDRTTVSSDSQDDFLLDEPDLPPMEPGAIPNLATAPIPASYHSDPFNASSAGVAPPQASSLAPPLEAPLPPGPPTQPVGVISDPVGSSDSVQSAPWSAPELPTEQVAPQRVPQGPPVLLYVVSAALILCVTAIALHVFGVITLPALGR